MANLDDSLPPPPPPITSPPDSKGKDDMEAVFDAGRDIDSVDGSLSVASAAHSGQYAIWFGFKYHTYINIECPSSNCKLSPIEAYYAPFLRALRVAEYVQTIVSSRGANMNGSDVAASKLLTTTAAVTTFGPCDTSNKFLSLSLNFNPVSPAIESPRDHFKAQKLQSMEYLFWALFQVYGKLDGIVVRSIK